MAKTKKKTPQKVISEAGAREKIIEVATALFGEKGLEGTSTRDISKASGLNISLISYYFGGKTGLYKTIIKEHAIKMRERIDGVVSVNSQKEINPENFTRDIQEVIRGFVEMRLANPDIAKIFMAERAQKMPYCKEVFEGLISQTSQKFAGMVKDGQKKGFIRNDFPPQIFVVILVEAVFGYFAVEECHLKMWDGSYHMPKDKEKLIGFLTQLFTRGIFV
jgi:TetR/AcrR family transcriptional regulator